MEKITRTEDEWRALLTPEQFQVLRRGGTECAFTGTYWDTKGRGEFHCAGCQLPLFSSGTKFNSGTGWPSFWQAIEAGRITERVDLSHGICRMEVLCARCDGHLGHVFSDGPAPTGRRYCINSASLTFMPEAEG